MLFGIVVGTDEIAEIAKKTIIPYAKEHAITENNKSQSRKD